MPMRTIVILIGLALLSACATEDDVSKRVYGQQLVCHKGHTQAVSNADSFVHLDHGDSPGPCPKEQ
jgi:hypothetical protein